MRLSDFGKRIVFPKKGVIGQAQEAKNSRINATAGVAKENHSFLTSGPLEGFGEEIGYAPTHGLKKLRERWKEKKRLDSLPIVTNGITHAIHIAGRLFCRESIILPKPRWENYDLIFEEKEIYEYDPLDPESLRQVIDKSDVVLFNYPHNPTGYSLGNEQAEKIKGIVKGKTVILDDAYEGLFFDNTYKQSLYHDLKKNNLVVKADGMTKEYFAWGLRIGFLSVSHDGEKLMDKAAAVVRQTVSSISNITQNMALKILDEEPDYSPVEKKYRKVKELAKDLDTLPFNSGFFFCVRTKDSEAVRKKLLEKGLGVAAFDGFIRVCFASVDYDDLDEMMKLIKEEIR
ncbi:MAG: aminotransferase class I/II-fold pyridoxal phosphate-dependent enzyme [Nanobdellota archaeon]